jgi:hypothetical protein
MLLLIYCMNAPVSTAFSRCKAGAAFETSVARSVVEYSTIMLLLIGPMNTFFSAVFYWCHAAVVFETSIAQPAFECLGTLILLINLIKTFFSVLFFGCEQQQYLNLLCPDQYSNDLPLC